MKVSVLLFISLCAFEIARAQVMMEPADRPVTLTGVIRELHAYGPPGWGETKKIDQRFIYLVMDLPRQINIPCAQGRSESASIECRSTRQLELFFSSNSADELELTAKKMRGRRVTLTGTLQRQIAPAEMTAIYIEVTAIENRAGDS
jgi:hypothetical protein